MRHFLRGPPLNFFSTQFRRSDPLSFNINNVSTEPPRKVNIWGLIKYAFIGFGLVNVLVAFKVNYDYLQFTNESTSKIEKTLEEVEKLYHVDRRLIEDIDKINARLDVINNAISQQSVVVVSQVLHRLAKE